MLDGIGLVDEEIPGSYGEDYDWLLRAARRAPIVVVRSPLTRAYWHQASFFADRWTSIIDAIHYLLAKFPELYGDSRGLALLYGRLAFAHAALGNGSEARMWARRTIRLDPRERRAYLAVAVSLAVGVGADPHATRASDGTRDLVRAGSSRDAMAIAIMITASGMPIES